MSTLTYFTATGIYLAATKDSLYDVDTDPELTPMSGAVLFTPMIDNGDSLPAPTLSPPANLTLAPVRAQIKSGVITTNGVAGVKLVANTAALGLEGDLFYRVDFLDGLLAGGKMYHPDGYAFQAPEIATTIDLVDVAPTAGTPVVPIPRNIAYEVNEDDEVTFYVNGVAVGDPFALPGSVWGAIVGKPTVIAAGADQAAARAVISAQAADPDLTAIASLTSAANKAPYFTGAGTAAMMDVTPAARALLDDTDTAAQRATLGALQVGRPTAVKTAGYTAVDGDMIPADATAGGFTIPLPSGAADDSVVLVKKIDTTSNPVTLQTSGSDVFNTAGGPTVMTLVIPGQTTWLQKKSNIWYVIGHGLPITALDERFVDFNSAQTITNKTLTTPKIAIISDTNGNEGIQVDATVGAVNFLRVQSSPTGQAITLRAAGDDANVGMQLRPKGTSVVSVLDSVGLLVTEFTTVTTPVNYWRLTSAATGGPLTARAIGADTDIGINLITKGAGKGQVNGIEIVTLTGAQTLTNKTLTAPLVDSLKDTNGNTALLVDAVVLAVNYLRVVNSVAGAETLLRSAGADTDIAIGIRPKGVASINMRDGAGNLIVQFTPTTTPVNRWQFASSNAGNPVTATASGTDTNIGINWVVKGNARAQVSGVNIPTVSSVDTLTFKTLTAPIISGGSGTATISAGTGTPEGAVTATVGSIFMRTDGGAATSHYVKESGSGNVGWVAK